MSERRRIERFSFEIPAKIETRMLDQEGHKGQKFTLQASNISSNGAFFPTSQPLREGTPVKVEMVLPLNRLEGLSSEYRQSYVEVSGTVLRSEPTGMAICFNEDHQISPCRCLPSGECTSSELPYERVAWDERVLHRK